MSKIGTTLQELGLSSKEVAVYIAALSLGDASIIELAKHAKLKRTTAYIIVESLETRGLIGTYKNRSGVRVRAQSPKTLITKLEKQISATQKILPALEALHQDKAFEPRITQFKGKAGYQAVLNDTLENHVSTTLFLGPGHEILETVSNAYIFDHYIPSRVKRKIHSKELIFTADEALYLKRDQLSELRQLRMLPAASKWRPTKVIYGSKVAFFSSPEEKTCMVIESEAIADMERKNFELLWNAASTIE